MSQQEETAWKIVLQNQGIVGKVIKNNFTWHLKRNPGVVSYEDMFNTGLLGLHKAVCMFNPKLGFKLSTYAFVWIRHFISRMLVIEGFQSVRIPNYLDDKFVSIRKKYRGSIPNSVIENEKNPALKRALEIMSTPMPINLDETVTQEEKHSATFKDFIVFHENETLFQQLDEQDLHTIVLHACRNLSARSKAIINARYGLEGEEALSLEEIGIEFDMSKERVRQIQRNSIEILRQYFHKNTVRFKEAREFVR